MATNSSSHHQSQDLDPATLFNLAALSLHIPTSPLLSSSAPACTSLDSTHSEDTQNDTNGWVNKVANSPERAVAYYDESLPFYLILQLPPTPQLTLAQATSFLLPSLLPSPHLTLSANLSYVEGSASTSNLPYSMSLAQTQSFEVDASDAGLNNLRQSTNALPGGPTTSSTSSAFPLSLSTSAEIPLLSYVFGEGEPEKEEEQEQEWDGKGKGKAKQSKRGKGRVWIGKKAGEVGGISDNSGWIAVWEFYGTVSFLNSRLIQPKLSVVVTLTFRDDPRLGDLLMRNGIRRVSVDDGKVDLVGEEEEYMLESFDDVNLLEGLDDSYLSLHLPASRLPRPPSTTRSRQSSHRISLPNSPQTSSHRRSLSLSTNHDLPLFPSIIRSTSRLLSLHNTIDLKMRTVVVPATESISERQWGVEENDRDGMIVCFEIEGLVGGGANGKKGERIGFEIEDVQIVIKGGRGGRGEGDVEVRRIKEPAAGGEESEDAWPSAFVLKEEDQYNLLYKVTFLGLQEDSAFENLEESGRGSSDIQMDDHWLRNVHIEIFGKPVRLDTREVALSRSLTSPALPAATTVTNSPSVLSPTESFSSHWNFTLDISPLQHRSRTHRAIFQSAIPSLFPKNALPPFMTSTKSKQQQQEQKENTPAKRRSKAIQPLEAIAGSKRHTLMGMSISQKELNRLSGLSDQSGQSGSKLRLDTSTGTPKASARDLPPPPTPGRKPSTGGNSNSPLSPTTTTTGGGARRFFSLPSSNNPPPPTPPPTTTSQARPISLTSSTNRSESPRPLSVQSPPPQSMNLKRDSYPFSQSTGNLNLANSNSTGLGVPSQIIRPNSTSGIVSGTGPGVYVPNRRSSSLENMYRNSSGRVVSNPPGGIGMGSPLPRMNGSISNSNIYGPSSPAHREDILISISLIPLISTATPLSPTLSASSKTSDKSDPRGWRTPRVGVLEVFLIEVFVLNRSKSIKRFTVGVPGNELVAGGEQREADGIIALENDVRIGPLAPSTCQSVRLRFLALRPGVHTVRELRLHDLGTGLETRLIEPVGVIVE